MENIYDKAARKAIKLNPYGLLLWLLIGLDLDLRFTRWAEDTVVRIEQETDLEMLEHWIDLSATAPDRRQTSKRPSTRPQRPPPEPRAQLKTVRLRWKC